jgi:protein TonB
MPRLEALTSSATSAVPGRSAVTAFVSLGFHALLVAALVVLPLLVAQPLPEQAHTARAFLAAPLSPAAPPPPPPPAAARVASRAVHPPVASDAFVAPVEVPSEIIRDEGLDLGIEGGVAGGVDGGVPGGVVGGVVGGLPDAPAPPRRAPLRAGIDVRAPRKVRDAAPVYPEFARRASLQGIVIVECVIDERGQVQDAKVVKGLPLLDDAALDAVRQWRYAPSLLDGVPVPVLMTVTVTFQLAAH